MTRLIATSLAAALCFCAAAPALAIAAQSDDHDALVQIYMVTISQEICSFEISDAQSETLGGATDKLEERLGLTEEASQKLYDQITAALERQKAEGLCNPNGDWARTYKETLTRLGK